MERIKGFNWRESYLIMATNIMRLVLEADQSWELNFKWNIEIVPKIVLDTLVLGARGLFLSFKKFYNI